MQLETERNPGEMWCQDSHCNVGRLIPVSLRNLPVPDGTFARSVWFILHTHLGEKQWKSFFSKTKLERWLDKPPVCSVQSVKKSDVWCVCNSLWFPICVSGSGKNVTAWEGMRGGAVVFRRSQSGTWNVAAAGKSLRRPFVVFKWGTDTQVR